jgi:membrane protein
MNERLLVTLDALRDRAETFFDGGPYRRGVYSLWWGLGRHRVGRAASAMAFNLFLAAIPMLAFAGWIIAQVLRQSPEALGSTSLLLEMTPAQVHVLIRRHFERFSGGAVAPFALVGTLWLASGAYHTLMAVFEVMVGAPRRAWWRKRLIALLCVLITVFAFTGIGLLGVWLSGGPISILHELREDDGLDAPLGKGIALGLILMGATGGMAGFFRIAVRRPGVRRRVWPGASLTVAIGGLASFLFAYYARTIAEFALFYGGLAAVAISMAWIWIWCFAMLVGAELNAQLEGGDRMPPSRVLL